MKWLLHYNPGLPHQREHAAMFAQAGVEVTPDRDAEADVHIVSGPYYALERWKHHPRLIWLDRAFWDDPRCVSLCWYRDGERTFPSGEQKRPHPEPFEWQTRESTAMVVADYGQDTTDLERLAAEHFDYVRVRRHPAEGGPEQPGLMLADVVIGHSTTTLVEAAIKGRPVICTDLRNPVQPVASDWGNIRRPDRAAWLHGLSWAQWSLDEIASGEAIEALKQCQNTS